MTTSQTVTAAGAIAARRHAAPTVADAAHAGQLLEHLDRRARGDVGPPGGPR